MSRLLIEARGLSGLSDLEANVNRYIVALVAVAAAIAVFGGTGCDKIKVPGNVAGQLINEGGVGQGYLSVRLCDAKTGADVATQTAEDSGNFFFDHVDPGRYIIKTYYGGEKEVPNDCKPFTLAFAKTLKLTITLYTQQAGDSGAGE